MKIILEVPKRTVGIVVTLIIDNFSEMQMRTRTIETDEIKDGAHLSMLSPEEERREDE